MDPSHRSAREQSPPRRQRACEPCSTAKARCHFQDVNVERHVCDRCQKMKIKCTAKSSRRLRKARQIKPLGSRVLSLEQQIHDLTTVLENRNRTSPQNSNSSSSGLGTAGSKHSPVVLTPDSPPPTTFGEEFCPGTCHDQNLRPRKQIGSATEAPFDLTWLQATQVLAIFREKHMRIFPYVVIKEDVSPQQLCEMKPFLFRVVMMVAAPLPVKRTREMKDEVMAYLGQRLLVEDERTLDLLQGLLVCIAWADMNTLVDQQVTNLTYLALGYAHNLNITTIPIGVLEQIGMDDGPDDLRRSKKTKMVQKVHSTDEQRAFLGTLCILSLNSTHFGRQSPLKGKYVDICCDSLERIAEYSSDFLLERTIRMIQIGDKISGMFGAANDREREKPYLFLVEEHAASFRAELDAIMESTKCGPFQDAGTPSSMASSSSSTQELIWREKAFKLHYNYLLVRLYEPATYLTKATDEGGSGAYRIACVRNCLFAAKEFFDIFLSLTVSKYLYQSVTITEQITFVMIMTTRLLLTSTRDWDVSFARQTIDFVSIMSKLAKTLEEAEREREADTRVFAREMGIVAEEAEIVQTGYLTDTMRKTRWIRDWFVGKVEREEREEREGREEVAGVDEMEGIDEMEGWGAGGGTPFWFTGLLSNSAWNFDGVEL